MSNSHKSHKYCIAITMISPRKKWKHTDNNHGLGTQCNFMPALGQFIGETLTFRLHLTITSKNTNSTTHATNDPIGAAIFTAVLGTPV